MKVGKSTIIRLIIGMAILVVVIWFARPESLWAVLVNASLPWLLIAIIIHIIATSLTALRIAYLLERLDLFLPIFKANLGGMVLADVTPGRTGYFVTPLIVHEECPEVGKGETLNVMFFGQIFDFLLRACLLAFAMLTIFFALGVSQNMFFYGFLSLLFVVALTIGFTVLAYNKIPQFLVPVIDRIPFVNRLYRRYSKYADASDYAPRKAIVAFLITVVGWLVTSLRWISVGLALGLVIPIEWYLFLFPALTAVSFIPVSLAGLGVVEGGFALVFFVLGQESGLGVAFALVDRAVALIGDLFGLPFTSKVGKGLQDLTQPIDDEIAELETESEEKLG